MVRIWCTMVIVYCTMVKIWCTMLIAYFTMVKSTVHNGEYMVIVYCTMVTECDM